jgi:hypothetical protein
VPHQSRLNNECVRDRRFGRRLEGRSEQWWIPSAFDNNAGDNTIALETIRATRAADIVKGATATFLGGRRLRNPQQDVLLENSPHAVPLEC